MSHWPAADDLSRLARGEWNRKLGWGLLLLGFGMTAILDPWLFAATSAAEFGGSARPEVRHSQGVVLAMALLQIAMAHLLAAEAFSARLQQRAALLTIVGAIFYAGGYLLALFWPLLAWLVVPGSLLNLSAFAALISSRPTGEFCRPIRFVLPVVCFGMGLDLLTATLQFLPQEWVAENFGAGDQVRLRMLRLARVAAIALSVLTLLYFGLLSRSQAGTKVYRCGGGLVVAGAIGMPAILAAACFLWVEIKYSLPLPATAVTCGVILGLALALRHARPLEQCGWLMIAGSIMVGLLIGLFAFDGPLRPPSFLGNYNDWPRRLTRIGHSYSIVLGIVAILISREHERASACGASTSVDFVGGILFSAGAFVAIGSLLLLLCIPLPLWTLAAGPTLVCMGIARLLWQLPLVAP